MRNTAGSVRYGRKIKNVKIQNDSCTNQPFAFYTAWLSLVSNNPGPISVDRAILLRAGIVLPPYYIDRAYSWVFQ